MKLGVLLPTFRDNAYDALATADAAERAGLDGVFAYDHLWPMGSPTRPSFAPMPVLSAVAARTESLKVGTLVARMALVGTSTLVERFLTLEALAPGRVIAGLGTGDDLSKDEQIAYDVGYPTAEERWALLADAMAALQRKGGDLVRRGTSRDRGRRARARRDAQPLGRDARACSRRRATRPGQLGGTHQRRRRSRRSINFVTRERPGSSSRCRRRC